MNEKKRTPKQKETPGGGDSIFDANPGLPINTMVGVSSGPYAEDLPVAGTTVGEVRRKFKDRFDIDDKATAIVNGNTVDDETVLKAGDNLMFVRHAGEKGAATVTIKGNLASVEGSDYGMDLPTLCDRVGPSMSTGPVILPAGMKAVLSQGNITIWVWEKPPHIAHLRWITPDSPSAYGPGTKYQNVNIALPYLVIFAVFGKDDRGLPRLLCKDECFFRNEPLKSIEDELCYPALLNCSKFSGGVKSANPLSWICTQYIKADARCNSNNAGDRFQGWFEAVRHCLLDTGFNLSSEHHEANSWYGESKKIDQRIATTAAWEAATKKDPLFVLELPWLKTGLTVQGVADRIFKIHGASSQSVQSADDLARIITNG